MRSARKNWQDVRFALDALLQSATYAPNAKLPAEGALCVMLGAGRHSLRRAVRALVEENKLITRQGKGTFVAAAPLDYLISKRTRASANLAALGLETAGQILGIAVPYRSPIHAEKLGLASDAPLIQSRNKRFASGKPLSLSTTYVSQARFPDWAELLEKLHGHTAILRHYDIADYQRIETVIFARPASRDETFHLELPPHAWVMVTQKLDASLEGVPLIYGESIWAADRIQFTITDERTFS